MSKSESKTPETLDFGSALSELSTHHEHLTAEDVYKYENIKLPRIYNESDAYEIGNGANGLEPCRTFSMDSPTLPRMNSRAQAAAQGEHHMTFRQGLRLYPKAIFWSAAISMAIVMEGYDTALVNSFYAFPQFRASYGVLVAGTTDDYEIPVRWQAALGNGAVAGSVIGLLINGVLTERFGYRHTMMASLAALSLFIFIPFFAFNIQTLLAGQILCGLPWGIFSTLTATYAAEVMPLTLRGYLTANVNLCWLIGQLTAYGTLRGCLEMETNWSYRIPFGLQWMWVTIIFAAAFFAPESPWFLVRKNRLDEAKASLKRLTRKHHEISPENTIAMMLHTDTVERKLNVGKGQRNDLSYLECFRGTNLRRTEIACMTFMTQNLCGLPMIGFSTYFYNQIGFNTRTSFDLTMGMHGLAIVGALVSLFLMKHFGRRIVYLSGLGICFAILIIGGVVGSVTETRGTLWAMAGLIMLFIFVFDCTVGPLTYCLVAEIPSTRLRVNTVVLARIAYNLNSMITNILSTKMLNPLAWNWKAKSCFVWAGTCFLCLIYCYFRLPETKGLTYHELDILFEKKADARKFKVFQKKLEENGYFSVTDRQEDSAWHV